MNDGFSSACTAYLLRRYWSRRHLRTSMSSAPYRRMKATVTGKATKTVTWKGKEHPVNALASKWLEKLEAAFAESQSNRARNAVYLYLTAVYGFTAGFKTSPECVRVVKCMAD